MKLSARSMSMRRSDHLGLLLLGLLAFSATIELASGQFLFTYEINQESDDSRAPKSSLFDPSSFRIVTPAQLQSSYQKLATQTLEPPAASSVGSQQAQAESASSEQPASGAESQAAGLAGNDETNGGQQSSLLKQTSAALQSFAELFNFGSASPSSSPAPLSSNSVVDQQAEARSLHEHWAQQQQKAHQQQQQQPSALQSFTTSQPGALQHQQPAQHQQHQQQHQQPSQASYWLTANPLNPPDGNFLVQIKQQPAAREHSSSAPSQLQASTSPASLVDNLLAVGHQQRAAPHALSAPRPKLPASSAANLAQASFLSTPTSYYPSPAHVETATRVTPMSQQAAAHQQQHAPPHQVHHQAAQAARVSAQASFSSALERGHSAPLLDLSPQHQQLQPPANLPESFHASAALAAPAQQPSALQQSNQHAHAQPTHHKSAEESLNAFRQQQQHQHQHQQHQQHQHQHPHQHQNPLFAHQQNQLAQQQHQQQHQHAQQPQRNAAPQQSQAPKVHQQLGEIPKVSPQIYESFLLQQKDQHEKHMELLKQQQELNRLLEQKHKQQEAELRRRKKKEELEAKEAQRKKALREQQEAQARKLKLEEEERERQELMARKRRDEEERKRADEQRRYREFLEQRERERHERELEKRRRQAKEEEEARELKLRQERELAEQRRLAAAAEAQEKEKEAALKRRKEKEAEEAKYLSYLRQQEELRKLLELKQKEDEALQQRRRQAAQQQAAATSTSQRVPQTTHSQAGRAGRLAQEHRERMGAASWGAPIRTRGASASAATEPATPPSFTTSTSTSTSTLATLAASEPTSSAPRQQQQQQQQQQSTSRPRVRGYLVKKQRTLGDEKLIRQKIPLYSGPGKYGFYRANNESLANDLAALLDSVTLPSSTTSTTTSTTSTTTTPAPAPPADEPELTTRRHAPASPAVTPSLLAADYAGSSSLSPLLSRANYESRAEPTGSSPATPTEPFFDDDVPRRPARGLARSASQPQASRAHSSLATSSSASGSLGATQRLTQSATAATSRSSFNQSAPAAASRAAHIGLASLPPDSDNDGIPGRAGVEYPVLAAVPPTSFSCSKQPLNGYYADTETACQVVHLCQGGAQSSILCPNGTIFNQEKFSCQWWYEVNCSRAPIFYQLNDNLYKAALPLQGAASSKEPAEAEWKRNRKQQQQNQLAA